MTQTKPELTESMKVKFGLFVNPKQRLLGQKKTIQTENKMFLLDNQPICPEVNLRLSICWKTVEIFSASITIMVIVVLCTWRWSRCSSKSDNDGKLNYVAFFQFFTENDIWGNGCISLARITNAECCSC